MIKTTTTRAVVFGAFVAAALTLTLENVVAAEPVEVIQLDPVMVTAHRDHFDAEGNLKVIQLDPVLVVASKSAV